MTVCMVKSTVSIALNHPRRRVAVGRRLSSDDLARPETRPLVYQLRLDGTPAPLQPLVEQKFYAAF